MAEYERRFGIIRFECPSAQIQPFEVRRFLHLSASALHKTGVAFYIRPEESNSGF